MDFNETCVNQLQNDKKECLKFALKSTHRFRRGCGYEMSTPSSLNIKIPFE
jgi:hypothetical protein